jgi:hypothetical protein
MRQYIDKLEIAENRKEIIRKCEFYDTDQIN